MIGGVTPKMLTQTLRRLEASGLLSRTVYAVSPPKVEYTLTPLGETLIAPLTALCRWSEEYAPEVATLQENLFMVEASKALV
jgi:DNA-binding HxlR family transcriptional regulator